MGYINICISNSLVLQKYTLHGNASHVSRQLWMKVLKLNILQKCSSNVACQKSIDRAIRGN